jgi:hypothetical protein
MAQTSSIENRQIINASIFKPFINEVLQSVPKVKIVEPI